MPTLTKAQIAESVSDEIGFARRDSKRIVDRFFEEIRVALERNESVKLSGFGNFELRDKRERPGRNPKTGEPAPVSARRVVRFRPSQKLRRRLQWTGPDHPTGAGESGNHDNLS